MPFSSSVVSDKRQQMSLAHWTRRQLGSDVNTTHGFDSVHVNKCIRYHAPTREKNNFLELTMNYSVCITLTIRVCNLDSIVHFTVSLLQYTGCMPHITVIHLEVGSSVSRDSYSQNPASPSDKRLSPAQHFTSFPVQNAWLHLWNILN